MNRSIRVTSLLLAGATAIFVSSTALAETGTNRASEKGQGIEQRRAAGTTHAGDGSTGRLRDLGNGVLEQASRGLQWHKKDNGDRIKWDDAGLYCGGLQTAGGGWRLPSVGELQSLFHKPYPPVDCGGSFQCHVSPLFSLTAYSFWSQDKVDTDAMTVDLHDGTPFARPAKRSSGFVRALCVRGS